MNKTAQQPATSDASSVGQCPCGKCRIAIKQMPDVRFYCHCTICQKVYPGDFADATVMLADKVDVLTPDAIEYAQHKSSGGLDRGVCRSCRHPVVAYMSGPLTPRFAFVPTVVLPNRPDRPPSKRHLFYGTRAADVNDDLPKTKGELTSLLALTPAILKVILRR